MSTVVVDMTGWRFGRLSVVGRADTDARGVHWNVRCDCGNHRTILTGTLRSGHTRSCGCLHAEVFRDAARNRNRTHGHASQAGQTPEYRAWRSAKDRTTNPQSRSWANYGGRGIRMTQEWLDSFEAFIAHIGPRPGPRYSLDRINNDGHYEPGNVRWATLSEQRRNQRRQKARDNLALVYVLSGGPTP